MPALASANRGTTTKLVHGCTFDLVRVCFKNVVVFPVSCTLHGCVSLRLSHELQGWNPVCRSPSVWTPTLTPTSGWRWTARGTARGGGGAQRCRLSEAAEVSPRSRRTRGGRRRRHGQLRGAGLSRFLRSSGVRVVEVNRTSRLHRWKHGKFDAADAEAAARSVLSGEATDEPNAADGHVEMLRALKIARRSAVKARTQAANQLHARHGRWRRPKELRREHGPCHAWLGVLRLRGKRVD